EEDLRAAGAGGGDGPGGIDELVGVGGGQAAAGVGEAGPAEGDLGVTGRGGHAAVGGGGLVQEDRGRGGSGDVAGRVLVPGVEGLGAIARAEIGRAACREGGWG